MSSGNSQRSDSELFCSTSNRSLAACTRAKGEGLILYAHVMGMENQPLPLCLCICAVSGVVCPGLRGKVWRCVVAKILVRPWPEWF